ncbi:MAG: enoyl-CoA hydratase/isomerase family protein [Deltaproteobacteria bacterium]|nr:enoyl-CoA hydratase/isomerase family protein [Deltaproteobacteria bacterium]
MSELLVEKQGGVTILTLNRPDRMNAISGPMLAAFSEQLLEANRDPEVRVVVITGAGRAFCAGLDLKEQASGGNLGGGFDLREAPPVVLHQMDKPTIAAINGGAAGYGMDLAIGCDIRLASDAAKLSAAFTKRGVIPESGGTWLMPRLVGWAKASEIFFTGRTLGADECLELGLVSKVVPGELLMKEALALAHEIAANAPLAVQGTKRMMRMALTETFEANVHHVYLQLLPLFRSKDFSEGVKSFLEKRPPKFEGK